jgi:tetratricopeptide (TPR) repeat protein
VLGIAALAGLFVLISRLRAGEIAWELDDRRADELARASGHTEIEVLLDAIRAARAIAVEPIAVAEERSQAALERGTRHGVISSTGVRVLQAFVLRREQHRLHELEPLLALGAGSGRAGLHGLLAACRYEAGDRDGAVALVEQFVRDALPALQHDWVHDAALALAADVACDLELSTGAAEMYERLCPAAGQIVVMASASLVVGRTDRYLGRLALLQKDFDGAIGHFQRARELDDATGARLWAGWAAHDEAVAQLARCDATDVEHVEGLLRTASGAARWAGSRRLAAAVVELRGR